MNLVNKTMKLTDFPETDHDLIKLRLSGEEENWRQSPGWKGGTSKSDLQMQEWNRKFMVFKERVLADKDIEESFFSWSGCDLINPDMKKINAPQYGFFEMYRGIKRRFDI